MSRDYKPGRPVGNTEMFLAAILDNVQALRADLAAISAGSPPAGEPQVDDSPQVVDLREPAPAGRVADLAISPAAVDALNKAGILAIANVPRTEANLVAIRGIGKVLAGEILEALNE